MTVGDKVMNGVSYTGATLPSSHRPHGLTVVVMLGITWTYPCRNLAALMGLALSATIAPSWGWLWLRTFRARSIVHHADGSGPTGINRGACMEYLS